MKHRVVGISLGCLIGFAGCAGDEPGSSAARLSEAEITIMQGATTTIRLAKVSYAQDSGKIKDIVLSVNGVEAGRMEAAYTDTRLTTLDVLDADGDRGEISFAYQGSRVTAMQFAAPSAFTMLQEYAYDDGRDGVPREVMTRMTPVNSTAQTSYRRFEHDDRGFLNLITDIEGQNTSTIELRYDELDRLERATTLASNTVADTHTFEYDTAGRIESVSSLDNDRWDVFYGTDGRIEQIRKFSPGNGETVTIRYRYLEGSLEGIRFTPDLPHASLFDLGGLPSQTVDFLTLTPAALSTSVPSPVGGGGGGGDLMCAGYTAETTCNVCEFTYCCSQLETCVNSTDCTNFYDCAVQCTDNSCYEQCGSFYPTGRTLFESYYNCSISNCDTQCQ